VTAREKLHQVIVDLPEEDCESFSGFILAVKEGKTHSQLTQVYADLPQSTHDSVQRTLSRLEADQK
jgi:hypothetical protein